MSKSLLQSRALWRGEPVNRKWLVLIHPFIMLELFLRNAFQKYSHARNMAEGNWIEGSVYSSWRTLMSPWIMHPAAIQIWVGNLSNFYFWRVKNILKQFERRSNSEGEVCKTQRNIGGEVNFLDQVPYYYTLPHSLILYHTATKYPTIINVFTTSALYSLVPFQRRTI